MKSEDSSFRGGGRRNAAVALGVLAMIGVALLVWALATQVGAPPQPELRPAEAASDGGGATPSQGTTTPEPSPIPSTDAEESTEKSDPAESMSAHPAPLPAAEPSRITIASLGVDEQVFPIGLGEDGKLLAPRGDRANQPAWFEGSPTPGENGPSVIEGHVTWGGDPSIFFELGALEAGDRIEVEREDGTTATFEVYDSARYPKDEFPTLAVYGRTEGPELRLITCGGDLGADGHHLDNTVVYARLVQG